MALTVTNGSKRQLATKVTFLYLEFEDLFVLLPGSRDEHVRPILAREMFVFRLKRVPARSGSRVE